MLFFTHISYSQTSSANTLTAVPGQITTIEKSYTDGVLDGYTIYIPSIPRNAARVISDTPYLNNFRIFTSFDRDGKTTITIHRI